MTNKNLSGDQKSQRLFGRPEDYISHVQYFCVAARNANTDYLLAHNYISEKGKKLSHGTLTHDLYNAGTDACDHADYDIRGRGNVNIDVATLFYTNQPEYTLQGS